jgi:hypothetical protein
MGCYWIVHRGLDVELTKLWHQVIFTGGNSIFRGLDDERRETTGVSFGFVYLTNFFIPNQTMLPTSIQQP